MVEIHVVQIQMQIFAGGGSGGGGGGGGGVATTSGAMTTGAPVTSGGGQCRFVCCLLQNHQMIIPDICHFFTRTKFLENKIYTENC